MLNRRDIEKELEDRLDKKCLDEKQLIRVVESVQRLLVTQTWLVMDIVSRHPNETDEQLRKMILGKLKHLL